MAKLLTILWLEGMRRVRSYWNLKWKGLVETMPWEELKLLGHRQVIVVPQERAFCFLFAVGTFRWLHPTRSQKTVGPIDVLPIYSSASQDWEQDGKGGNQSEWATGRYSIPDINPKSQKEFYSLNMSSFLHFSFASSYFLTCFRSCLATPKGLPLFLFYWQESEKYV